MTLVNDHPDNANRTPQRFSYAFIALVLILAGWLHLGAPLVAVLFAYLAVSRLHVVPRATKWIAVGVFLVLVFATTYGLAFFTNQTVRALPEIADKAIPSVIQFARNYEIELPFTDYDSLKETAIDAVKSQARYWGSVAKFAQGATKEVVLLMIGIIVAIALFLNPRLDLPERPTARPVRGDLYSACARHITTRFRTFYKSFELVMGAQIIISAINTILTAIFVITVDLPYPVVIVGVTFLCGLLPVVGNLMSNTIIVGVGFTISPRMAIGALIFLVVIHKLEYLLNSKIIGHRIRNPVWLTLSSLVVGEVLMGIPGMILAPVVLHYVRTEASAVRLESEPRDVEHALVSQ